MTLTLKLNIADEEKKKPLSPNSRKIVTIVTTLIKTSDTIILFYFCSETLNSLFCILSVRWSLVI